jgi:2-furoyl-CoA dehydrogenase large subunit
MRGGDAHGPDRIFDVEIAFNDEGIVRSMKMRALDNAGAYAGRAPFQLGKPIGAIVGPYQIESVQYHALSVITNKAPEEAVRGFGQSPTNYAIEMAIDKVAEACGLDRIEVRRRNFIRKEQFPYLIPSGTHYDSGDYHTVAEKVLAHVNYTELKAERDRLRQSGMLAGIGVSACLEPSGGNSSFEPLLNEKNTTTTWMDSCRINVDGLGFITATMHTTSSGQGHETLVATVVGEVLEIEPDRIRVVRPDTLASLPSNSPVGSRMAIMLGGAAFHAAQIIKAKVIAIARHQFGRNEDDVTYSTGGVVDNMSGKRLEWADIMNTAHRHYHLLPKDMLPGMEATYVMQVPTATKLPENGRVQMYPAHSFEFHVVLVAIDPKLGKPEIKRYVIGHDCGTVINPDIVKGMTLGGIAHGIGAALLEEFVYDDEGQFLTGSFMDYLLPSSHEVPHVEMVHHCTPSPFTVFGQKGSGECGYLGGPAAVSGAVNDAVRPLGISFSKLPIRASFISDAVAAALEAGEGKTHA